MRAYKYMLLYPVYDEKREHIEQIVELKHPLIADWTNDLSKTSVNSQPQTAKRPFVGGLNSLDMDAPVASLNELYITDSIIDSLAITEVLQKPAISITSVDALTPYVSIYCIA